MGKHSFYINLFIFLIFVLDTSFAFDLPNNTRITYAMLGRWGCSENFTISDEEISLINESLHNLPEVSYIKEFPPNNDDLFNAEIHLSNESKRDVIDVTLLKDHWLLSYNFSDMKELKKGHGEEDEIGQTIARYKNCENYNEMVLAYIINPIPDLGCDLFSSGFECRRNSNFSEIEISLFNIKLNDSFVHFGTSGSIYMYGPDDWDSINKIRIREIIFSETPIILNGREQQTIKKQSVFLSTIFYPAYYKEQQLENLREEIRDYEDSLNGKFWFRIFFFEKIPMEVISYKTKLKNFQEFISNAREELSKNGFYQEYYSDYLSPTLDKMEFENQEAKESLNRILSIKEEAKTTFILYLTILAILSSLISVIIYFLEKRNNEKNEDRTYKFLNEIKESLTREGTNLKLSLDNFWKETINKKDQAVKKFDTSLSRVSTATTYIGKEITKSLKDNINNLTEEQKKGKEQIKTQLIETNEGQKQIITILKEINDKLDKKEK